jgi:hypothetical protein
MRPGIAFRIQFLPNKLPRPDMRWRRNVTAKAEAKITTEAWMDGRGIRDALTQD